jgi:hypothetical protein
MNKTTNDRASRHSSRRFHALVTHDTKERPEHSPTTALESPSRTHKLRAPLVVGAVIAALIVSASGMRWYDQSTRATRPTWFAACQEAVNATAQLHRLQAAQLEQAMELTFGAVAGIRPGADTIDQSEIARLQRNADQAIFRCTGG